MNCRTQPGYGGDTAGTIAFSALFPAFDPPVSAAKFFISLLFEARYRPEALYRQTHYLKQII